MLRTTYVLCAYICRTWQFSLTTTFSIPYVDSHLLQDGSTGVLLAAHNGHRDTVELLIHKRADTGIANKV